MSDKKAHYASPRAQEIRDKIKMLKDRGMLPKGYAKEIMKKYPHLNENTIYGAASGRAASEEVQNAIIEIAMENKEMERIKKLNELLEID